jgi:hypothetical protein
VGAGQLTRVIGGSASLMASTENDVSAVVASPMATSIKKRVYLGGGVIETVHYF